MVNDNDKSLKILREVNNYTQAYIGEYILGISQTSYARLEQKPSKITASQAKLLANLYGIKSTDLLSGAELIIRFKDDFEVENFYCTTLKNLKLINDFLVKQNTELIGLVRVLSEKLSKK